MSITCNISVIIPVYNSEKYVSSAVDSVLAQRFRPDQIIVVDDGSTDRTNAILAKYLAHIQLVSQQHLGEAAARNTGIRSATGDFLAFLDSDDLWLPDKLELQIECFRAHPNYGLVYTDISDFDETGLLHERVDKSFQLTPAVGYAFPLLFSKNVVGTPSTVVVRRECFEKVGLFDDHLMVGCDYDMWLRLARHFEFGYIDKPLVKYRQHANMCTHTAPRFSETGVPWAVTILKKTLETYPKAIGELEVVLV